jgi:hypothetical protein
MITDRSKEEFTKASDLTCSLATALSKGGQIPANAAGEPGPAPQPFGSPLTIFPNISYAYDSPLVIQDRSKEVFGLFGCISYTDPANRAHYTRFCFEGSLKSGHAGNGAQLAACPVSEEAN